jgi:hypothetical protein
MNDFWLALTLVFGASVGSAFEIGMLLRLSVNLRDSSTLKDD